MRALALAILACVIGSGWAHADEKPANPDRALLEMLKDHSQPREFMFFMRFPGQAAAERVVTQVKTLGLDARVELALNPKGWAVTGTRRMIPSEAELAKWRKDLTEIAVANGGTYDGTGLSVTH